jgi:hypothetical protein
MSGVQVIDDFLDKDHHEHILDVLTNVNTTQYNPFPWMLSSSVSTTHDTPSNNFYMYHLFYFDHAPSSEYISMTMPILDRLDVKSIMRIKANLYPNTPELVEHEPHIDLPFSHKGAVYMVNDNDGCTILDDGTRVESKANRILLFDPSVPHQATNCTNSKCRVTINFNYF